MEAINKPNRTKAEHYDPTLLFSFNKLSSNVQENPALIKTQERKVRSHVSALGNPGCVVSLRL